MSEQIPEKFPKKVKIHSITSFWWHAVKRSFRNAREPIGTIEGILDLILGISAVAFITRRFSQEGLDYMIYLFLAVPTIVCGVFFLWNLIKNPHKIYKEDLTAVISGSTPVFAKEITSRHFGRVFFITIIVSAFVALLSVKNLQIAQLKKPLPLPEKIAAQKPLPTKIIPNPEPPPIVSAKQTVAVETQKQFEIFNAGAVAADDVALITKLKAEKSAKEALEKQQRDLDIQKWWNSYLSYYQHSLIALHDALLAKATKSRDGIAQSVGYFQCLSSNMDPNIGEIEIAEIGLQKNTNVNFLISITSPNSSNHRQLKISCSAGYLELEPGFLDQFHAYFNLYPDFNYDNSRPIDKADECIRDSIAGLIDAQYDFLRKTNK